MFLQHMESGGSSTQVYSHGHDHHQSETRPREDVVLCAVYHFSEPKEAIERIQAKYPNVRFIWHTLDDTSNLDHDGRIPEADYRAATIYLTFSLSPPSLDLMPNLRLIQLLTSGSDHVRNTPLLSNPSIPVATCSGVSARPISQYVVLQILSWAHKFPQVLEVMSKRRWTGLAKGGRGYPMGSALAGKRVGIWGYGSIGRQVARILHAMGMTIIACASSDKTTPESRRLYQGTTLFNKNHKDAVMGDDEGILPTEWHSGATRAGLHKFLSSDLDILAIFTPLTASTKHTLGRDEFDILSQRSMPAQDHENCGIDNSNNSGRKSEMKRQAAPFLVNVSRGPIIVQDELVTALKDGRLSGAALDVTDPEPLPEDHELWTLPNVSITPHMSWCFEEYVEDCLESVLEENLLRLNTGKKLVNQIR